MYLSGAAGCPWLVTDGTLIRPLLGRLIKAVCRKKSGGGAGFLSPWGKRAVGIGLALCSQGWSLKPRSLSEIVLWHTPGPQAGGERSLGGSSIILGQLHLP